MTRSHYYTHTSQISITIMKKKPTWSWKKFFEGAKRPAIALVMAALVAAGFDVNGVVVSAAALLLERLISSIEFKLKR